MGRHRKKNGYSSQTTSLRDNTEPKTIVSPEGKTKALASSFDAEVRPLIDLVDKLRGYGLDRDINLPAVAVIGDQSAGKSSVLEAISGVQLPRGTGIVTRCPLEMRMKHSEDEDKWEGKIMYKDKHDMPHEEVILNRESVGDLVRKAQKEMTDGAKGISDELITLEVTSSDVPDLTVIDLPGIGRNAVEGQPLDIEARLCDTKFPPIINNLYSDARRSFTELIKTAEERQPDTKNHKLRTDLQKRMEASRGREFCNFLGKFELVESCAREYISKLEAPALQCFRDVHSGTTEILKIVAEKCFEKFPDFAQRAKDVIMKTRKETNSECKDEIQRYFEMENLVYSQDKTYGVEFRTEEEKKRKEEEEEKERKQKNAAKYHYQIDSVSENDEEVNGVDKALMSLNSYYLVATRRLCDVIPMIIQLHVFREQVKEMRIQLMEIASDERTMDQIQEDADMAYMRIECKSRHERLLLAEEELDKI